MFFTEILPFSFYVQVYDAIQILLHACEVGVVIHYFHVFVYMFHYHVFYNTILFSLNFLGTLCEYKLTYVY